MKKRNSITKEILSTRIIIVLIALFGMISQSRAQQASHGVPHEMQHGFVLAADDKFASHLVATGHHSRQTEIAGELTIDGLQEMAMYQKRKALSAGSSYFLFQAQNLDLPSVKAGQVLTGYIVESKVGDYDPKNVIVQKATYKIEKVILNLLNPFFIE
jgi:hypothetical protein